MHLQEVGEAGERASGPPPPALPGTRASPRRARGVGRGRGAGEGRGGGAHGSCPEPARGLSPPRRPSREEPYCGGRGSGGRPETPGCTRKEDPLAGGAGGGRVTERLGAGVSECASGPGSAAADPPLVGSQPGVLYPVTGAALRPAALQLRPGSRDRGRPGARAPPPLVCSQRCLEPEGARDRENEKVKGKREGERERKERENMGASRTNCKQVCTCLLGWCVLNGRERGVMVAVVCVRV